MTNNYVPTKIVEHFRSSIVRGLILKLRFRKVLKVKIFIIKFDMLTGKYKDKFFWLPYKSVVDASSKYSVVGPKRRDPYANVWFEVKCDSEIYEQGLNDFIFHQKKLYKARKEMRVTQPFLSNELLLLTNKKTIKVLDAYVFSNKTNKPKSSF